MPDSKPAKKPFFSPEFCESSCPICTRARRGNAFCKFLQKIELLVTFGGCPWGRARKAKYGVAPNEPIEIEQETDV